MIFSMLDIIRVYLPGPPVLPGPPGLAGLLGPAIPRKLR